MTDPYGYNYANQYSYANASYSAVNFPTPHLNTYANAQQPQQPQPIAFPSPTYGYDPNNNTGYNSPSSNHYQPHTMSPQQPHDQHHHQQQQHYQHQDQYNNNNQQYNYNQHNYHLSPHQQPNHQQHEHSSPVQYHAHSPQQNNTHQPHVAHQNTSHPIQASNPTHNTGASPTTQHQNHTIHQNTAQHQPPQQQQQAGSTPSSQTGQNSHPPQNNNPAHQNAGRSLPSPQTNVGRTLPTPHNNTNNRQSTQNTPSPPAANKAVKPHFPPPPPPENIQIDLDVSTFFIDKRDPTGWYGEIVVNTKAVALIAKKMLETILNNYSEISGNAQSASAQQVKNEIISMNTQADKLADMLKNKCSEFKQEPNAINFAKNQIENLKDAIGTLNMSCAPNVFEGQPTSSIEAEKPTLLAYFLNLGLALEGILVAVKNLNLSNPNLAQVITPSKPAPSAPPNIHLQTQASGTSAPRGDIKSLHSIDLSPSSGRKSDNSTKALHTIDMGTENKTQPKSRSTSILTFRRAQSSANVNTTSPTPTPVPAQVSASPGMGAPTPTQTLSGELTLVCEGLLSLTNSKKKRYFQQKLNIIHYFNSAKEMAKTPLGSIDILQISTVSPIENASHDEFGFEIKAKGGKTFTLYANSEIERLKWITGLADWQMYLSTNTKRSLNRSGHQTPNSPAPGRPTTTASGQATQSTPRDPGARLKELEEKIPKEEKSVIGLEKLVTFYAKDPVGQKKAIEELNLKKQGVEQLRKEKQDIEKQLGIEPAPVAANPVVAEAPKPVVSSGKAEAILSKPINNSNLDGELQDTKTEIQNLIKQKKQLTDSKAPNGPGTQIDKLNKQVNDLKNRKKQILKAIEASGGTVNDKDDNESDNLASHHDLGKVEVLYDFQPMNPGELELKVGQIVDIQEEVDQEWYRGSIGGSTGMFPKNYVRKVDTNTPAAANNNNLSNNNNNNKTSPPNSGVVMGQRGFGLVRQQPAPAQQKNPLSLTGVYSTPAAQPNQPKAPGQRKVRALYDFEPMHSNELKFNAGDEIVCVNDEEGSEWWTGTAHGHTGSFPANYVERITESSSHHTVPPAQQHKPSEAAHATAKVVVVQQQHKEPEEPIMTTAPAALPSDEEKGKVIYDFEAGGPGEMSVSAGSIVIIRKYIDDEWLIAEADGEHGLVPIAYVEPIEEQEQTTTMEVGGIGLATVLYDFKPEKEGELEVKQGEVLTLLYAPSNEDWWRGKLRGVEGVVPRSYVD